MSSKICSGFNCPVLFNPKTEEQLFCGESCEKVYLQVMLEHLSFAAQQKEYIENLERQMIEGPKISPPTVSKQNNTKQIRDKELDNFLKGVSDLFIKNKDLEYSLQLGNYQLFFDRHEHIKPKNPLQYAYTHKAFLPLFLMTISNFESNLRKIFGDRYTFFCIDLIQWYLKQEEAPLNPAKLLFKKLDLNLQDKETLKCLAQIGQGYKSVSIDFINQLLTQFQSEGKKSSNSSKTQKSPESRMRECFQQMIEVKKEGIGLENFKGVALNQELMNQKEALQLAKSLLQDKKYEDLVKLLFITESLGIAPHFLLLDLEETMNILGHQEALLKKAYEFDEQFYDYLSRSFEFLTTKHVASALFVGGDPSVSESYFI